MPEDQSAESASSGDSSKPADAADSPEEINAEFAELHQTLSGWGLTLGPIRFSGTFGSQRITRIYVTLHVLLLLGGAALIVWASDALQDLGTALVVGSLFAFGAFVAQVWALQAQREMWVTEAATREWIDDLLERASRLEEKLPGGDDSRSSDGGSETDVDRRS